MIKLYNGDNCDILRNAINEPIDLVYGDCIYESDNFDWVLGCYELIKDNGIFIVQTDYHTVAEYKLLLDNLFGKNNFINWCIYIQEWGGISRRYFPRKHDDILIYSKGKDYKFYPERIMIPKVTAGTNLDKRGDGLKIPCDVFYDLGNFSTVAKERIKLDDKNIQWQKPLKLMDRLLLPFTDIEETILDCFMGSGTTGVWCARNNRSFVGIEIDPDIFEIATERLEYE